MGDVPTGDGIERVLGLESLSAPDGGEGGSVPQALGSKAEERAKRRKKKKDSYAKYLESPEWKKIRRRALDRDKHTCRACGSKAQHVHHIRYPKNLGEEKMEWLYSLCADCHNAIHRAATKMPLRKATDLILDASRDRNVIYLPPAKPPKGNRARWKKKPSRTPKKPKSNKELRREERARAFKKQQPKKPSTRSKKQALAAENDRLHEIQKRAKERRYA